MRGLATALAGALVAMLGVVMLQPAPAQVPAAGKQLFEKRCGGCHALDRDKEGPRLGGVLGRAAATVKSFQYSDALRKSGLVWTAENLDRWLADTEAMVPDSDMTFAVQSPEERQAIIEFLKRSGK